MDYLDLEKIALYGAESNKLKLASDINCPSKILKILSRDLSDRVRFNVEKETNKKS